MMKRGTGDDSVRTRARHVKNASHCEGNKGSKKGEGERAGRDGAAEILPLSAEKKYVPLRNGSKAPRVCFTTSYQSATMRETRKMGHRARKTRDVKREGQKHCPLMGWRFRPHVPTLSC